MILAQKSYTLSMSFDYAAIISATIFAIILLGIVELHVLTKERTDSDRNTLTDIYGRVDPSGGRSLADDEIKSLSAELDSVMNTHDRQFLMSHIGTLVFGALVVAQVLVIYWAAIDGHGPAHWLANFSSFAALAGIIAVCALLFLRLRRMENFYRRGGNRRYREMREFLARAALSNANQQNDPDEQNAPSPG